MDTGTTEPTKTEVDPAYEAANVSLSKLSYMPGMLGNEFPTITQDAIKELLAQVYKEGYEKGEDSQDEAIQESWDEGHSEGYSDGHSEGLADNIFTAWRDEMQSEFDDRVDTLKDDFVARMKGIRESLDEVETNTREELNQFQEHIEHFSHELERERYE